MDLVRGYIGLLCTLNNREEHRLPLRVESNIPGARASLCMLQMVGPPTILACWTPRVR